MTQYLTRREMREAERAGKLVSALSPEPLAETAIEPQAQPESSVPIVISEPQAAPAQPFLTRRERRLAEASGSSVPAPVQIESTETSSVEIASEPTPAFVSETILAAIEEVTAESEIPKISSSQDISIADFTGSNLLAEPSTQSLVLDIAPEAISLPLDTLDGTSTGSISILPDPNTGTLTGSLDGLAVDTADRVDAVTGVISMVDPVSAIDVINQRVTVGVVPDEALRKGFWQTWAYAALGVGLAVATIVATIAIITAVGE